MLLVSHEKISQIKFETIIVATIRLYYYKSFEELYNDFKAAE